MTAGHERRAGELAAQSLKAGDPTGWFERLYAAAAAGEAEVPWDRDDPSALLVEWARDRDLSGEGRRALVVGCGLGRDSEFVAGLGFSTTAFDVSETAIATARKRHPNSSVEYLTADLLNPPETWSRAFDLVVENMTVQALPDPPRHEAIVNVGRLVAPGGTLIVLAAATENEVDPASGPPWPLRRSEIEAFTADGLDTVDISGMPGPPPLTLYRWRAEFRRP